MGDMTAAGNGARQPAWLEWESAFIIPRDFVPSGRQNSTEKVRFIWNLSKWRWCHYSPAITLCNQHLIHNDPLQQNKKKAYCRFCPESVQAEHSEICISKTYIQIVPCMWTWRNSWLQRCWKRPSWHHSPASEAVTQKRKDR